MARPAPSRGMGPEDVNVLGGVPSQRMEVGFSSLSGRLTQGEHISQVYRGSPGGPRRGDSARKFRPGGPAAFKDNKVLASEREQFVQSTERDLRNGSSGLFNTIQRQGGSVEGESRRIANGNSYVGSGSNSVRLHEWAESNREGGLVGEADCGDMEERGEATSGSQSEGSEEEEDEEEGDIDGEEEADFGDQEQVGSIVERGMDGQKGYGAVSLVQMRSLEGRAEAATGLQGSENFQKAKFDRERVSKLSTSSAPSLGMFLSPSSTFPFSNSYSASPSIPPMLSHSEANQSQNGTSVVATGVGASPAYYRDCMTKETDISRDSYAKESSNSFHEPARVTHGIPLLEAIPIGTVPDAENYYTTLLQSSGVNSHKDMGSEAGVFSNKKGSEMGESPLRAILSDPVTGALMDDATILSCGHSFGSESLQRVLQTNACISCGATAKREDWTPNHALRLVVLAYKREMELWKTNPSKSMKRRRDQDRLYSGEQISLESSRGGVQFPYVVSDRVLIKGNKRTPERFVGREAVITTQCLNGWYVVRTVDNGESVKLQYRSLMKLGEQQPSSKIDVKHGGTNWL